MLRLSVHLAAGSSEGAAAAVAALANCPGASADPLRVACCECLDAGQEVAARQALELLLLRCTEARVAAAEGGASDDSPAEGLTAPGSEATVFQNLIKLVLVSMGADVGCKMVAAHAASACCECEDVLVLWCTQWHD